MRQPSFLLLLMLLGLPGCGSQSLVCPRPHLYQSSGKRVEPAADIKSIQERFDGRYSTNDLNETIASLRRSYPDADDDAIYNYLVAAYCPVTARAGASISTQRARLLSFENALHAVLGN